MMTEKSNFIAESEFRTLLLELDFNLDKVDPYPIIKSRYIPKHSVTQYPGTFREYFKIEELDLPATIIIQFLGYEYSQQFPESKRPEQEDFDEGKVVLVSYTVDGSFTQAVKSNLKTLLRVLSTVTSSLKNIDREVDLNYIVISAEEKSWKSKAKSLIYKLIVRQFESSWKLEEFTFEGSDGLFLTKK